MEFQNLYWLQAVLAAALALFLAVYLWRHRAINAVRYLAALLMAVSLWAAASALEYMSPELSTRLFWVKVQWMGAVWVAPTFLPFCLCLAGMKKWANWRRLWPLALLPLFIMLAVWTNPLHNLVWKAAWLEQSGSGVFTFFQRGPVFWIHITYAYLLLMVGTLVLIGNFWKERRVHSRKIGLLFLGLSLPWAANALYMFGVKPFSNIDFTPLAFGVAGVFFTLGVFRARLLDLIPLAREALMENLPDPVMVLDGQDRLVDINSAAQQLLGPGARGLLNQPVAKIFEGQPALKEILDSASESRTQLELDINDRTRVFEVRVSTLKDLRAVQVGRYLILRDITRRVHFQEKLTRNQERYRVTFEHTGTAMMICGGDTIIIMVNSKFAEIAGYDPADIQGKMSWRDFAHPEDLERISLYHRLRRETGEAPKEYEFRFVDRWGNVRWMNNTVQLVPGSEVAVASMVDISDRKRAQQRERDRLRRLQRQRASLVQLSTHPALVGGNLEATARVVTEALAHTMQAERTALWLLSEDGAVLRCLDSFKLSSQEHFLEPDLPTDEFSRYMRSLQSERAIPAYDAQRDPRTSEFKDIMLGPKDIVSSLDAGIRLSGRVRGVICVNQVGQKREWRNDEISFVAEIADQVAQALLNQERLRTQEALRESHERYSMFLDGLPDPVVVYDPEGRVQYLNSAFAETFGWTREELFNKRIPFVPPESFAETQDGIRLLANGGQVSNFATKRLTKDGRLLDVNIGSSPYHDELGDLAGNIVLIRDVTALTQAQARLAESEERYRSLAENSPYGLFVAEMPSGKVLYANQQLLDIFGYGMEDSQSLTVWQAIDPSDLEIAQKRFQQHSTEEAPDKGFVYSGRRKDGSAMRFKVSAAVVQGEGRQLLQGIVSDVTNEELMERQLRQAQKMEAVGTLAGGVAHEFNNLLMAIRGYSQLLSAHQKLEPAMRNSLEKISQTTRRAADLADTMLSFSKPETGQKKPVDLNQVLRSVQGLLRGTLPPSIEQRIELAPGLPLLMANPNQLEQVLLNLAVNARDAMPSGGLLTLRTAWKRADDRFRASRSWATEELYAEAVVEDSGHGLSRAEQARVFEPFYTTKEAGKGTGLGLFVAYSIITNHGGGIEVESAPGQGARFKIYLPADPELRPGEPQPKAAEELVSGQGQHILVVDDEASLREITHEALEAYGYQVEEARNGREALQKYEASLRLGREFDLVLLDLAMPVMDGAVCFQRLMHLNPAVKVIIATGHATSNPGLDNLAANPMAIIKKPFDLAELLKEVDRALRAAPN